MLLQACSLEKKFLPKEFIASSIEFRQRSFSVPSNKVLLQELQRNFNILSKDLSYLKNEIDFDFYTDIPPGDQREIKEIYTEYAKQIGITTTLEKLNLSFYDRIKNIITETPEEKELRNLSQLYGFVPPRKELFRVQFEYYVCLLLRRLGFNADKYQGNLSELVRESLKNFVENNPDILVSNDIAYLIECKSREEWKEESSFNKRILGELKAYDDYAEEIKANCAILLVESEFDKIQFYIALQNELERLKRILVVSYSYLVDAVQNKRLLARFKKVASNPTKFSSSNRIFTATQKIG